MAEVILDHVWKSYGGNLWAVNDFNLTIKDKEFMVFVGPSGCGKSTTLRMVAGLEEISKGAISIAGRVVNNVPPKDRDIAMVFQNYALYPHMTVYDNMAFGLKLRKYKRAEIESRVREASDILGITDYLHRKPKALSGGQRQRVAVGRAIVRKPKVFLFDEPLSNLDAKMRVQMRAEIIKLHARLEATMIYVTHDQVEAMTMGDRIVVMKDGVVLQVATPLDLYENPANLFVAGFIGTPPMNLFEGVIRRAAEGWIFDGETLQVALQPDMQDKLAAYAEKKVVMGIRPEHVGSPVAENTVGAPKIKARVDVVEPMGAETYLYMTAGRHTFIAKIDPHRRCAMGNELHLAFLNAKAHFFDPATTSLIV
ncbi:MAG: sn-glycerol-3-phosphate ABC transporter ATP-binding protein UgpC [Verrucomicrobia bacterium]|nr:sn-glycerol-3-phosphate ABC transporter ATP-binding protein UgpC [Verrucomicrobiota bacterium]MBU1736384.1 sn-glycerol-3-phosphate ABC transporter ATP-binding protein UgpC [Verrucomicrobiota bacterium]MBU1855459.1 sn-glycerol-3-phosphate ABC transporter ATP-binding protein UgpC [Verrucomicrobiota bacterium]